MYKNELLDNIVSVCHLFIRGWHVSSVIKQEETYEKQSKPPGGGQLDGYSCYPIYPICMSQLQTYNHTKASAFVLTDNIIKQADRLFFSNFNRP
jgi:hypothetical protein